MRATPLPSRRPLRATWTALLITVFGVGCDTTYTDLLLVTSPVISPSQYSLSVGDTLRIRATYSGRPCDCLWASSDEARATVDASGLVRGLTPGRVTVIASYRRDTNAKASALIEVRAP